MDTPSRPTLAVCLDSQRRAEELAKRWSAQSGSQVGYHDRVSQVHLHQDRDGTTTIRFRTSPQTSGIGQFQSMDARYLDDDSALETDAKAWYAAESARLTAEWDRRHILEETSEVRAYRAMTEGARYHHISEGPWEWYS